VNTLVRQTTDLLEEPQYHSGYHNTIHIPFTNTEGYQKQAGI